MIARADIVEEARRWIGTPYCHQASALGAGCDCIGLVRGVWRALIGPEPEVLPPYGRDWSEAGDSTALLEAGCRHLRRLEAAGARPGDVLLFCWRMNGPAKHVGILGSDTTIIHAYDAARAVVEVPLAPWWRRRVVCAFGFPEVSD